MNQGERTAQIPYMPALDGLRAVALLAVLAFHGGVRWVHGGYLPLTSFFVLSGFLITALLLAERTRRGGTDLRGFWERRIRRLVPAALLGLGLVALYLAVGTDRPAAGAFGDGIASLFWVTNWRFIATGAVYADAFADPSPLQHYWSLAVEEQFYLLLPLLFTGTMLLGRGRRLLFAAVVTAGALGSVAWMAHLHRPGDPPLRAYFGTDTRAAELLVGVLLALVLVDRHGRMRQLGTAARRALGGAGVVALAGSVASWFLVEEYDDRLYDGGLVVVALVAAVVVASCTQPSTPAARVLALPPLVWIGRLSYGIYLFHWPLFLWIDEEATGLSTAPLLLVRLAVSVGLAWLSWRFVETPVRTGALPVRLGAVGWANASVAVAALLVVATSVSVPDRVTLDAGAQEGQLPPPPPPPAAVDDVAAPAGGGPTAVPEAGPAPTPDPAPSPAPEGSPPAAEPGPGGPSPSPPLSVAPPTTARPAPLRIMVVGDSIARNLATGLRAWEADGAPVVVHDASIIGCTLGRGGVRHAQGKPWPVPEACGWWATSHLDEQVAVFQPEVILVQAGLNDAYDREHPAWEGRQAPGDPGADRYLLSEWVAAADRFVATGARVVWTTLPCTDMARTGYLDQDLSDARAAVINGRYMPAALARGATAVDLRAALCPAGSFVNEVAGVERARSDGIHLNDSAAAALARSWLGPELLSLAGR